MNFPKKLSMYSYYIMEHDIGTWESRNKPPYHFSPYNFMYVYILREIGYGI